MALGVLVLLLNTKCCSDTQVHDSTHPDLPCTDIVHPSYTTEWRYPEKACAGGLFRLSFEHSCSASLAGYTSMTPLNLQVPVSLGGVTLPWTSGPVIGMLEGGIFISILFILYEWKGARIPILPLYIFKIRSVSLIMIQTSLVGIVYYGNLCTASDEPD